MEPSEEKEVEEAPKEKKKDKKLANIHFPVKIFLDHQFSEDTVTSYVSFNQYLPVQSDYILKFKEKNYEIKLEKIIETLKKSREKKKLKEVESGIERLNILVVSKRLIKVLARCEIYCKKT